MTTIGEIYKFNILVIPEDWQTSKAIVTTGVDGEKIKVFLSFGDHYNCNGATYLYNDNCYDAFADLEALSIYIMEFCMTKEVLNDNIHILLPKYILVFIVTDIEDNTTPKGIRKKSLDLYIGTIQI